MNRIYLSFVLLMAAGLPGLPLPAPLQLSAPGNTAANPRVCGNAEGFAVTWVETTRAGNLICLSYRDKEGTPLLPDSVLPDTGSLAAYPEPLLWAGQLRLCWADGENDQRGIYFRDLNLQTGEYNTRGPRIAGIPDTANHKQPVQGWDGTHQVLLWCSEADNLNTIFFAF